MQLADSSSWGIVSAVASLVTLIGTVGVGGMMWGKLTERVGGQTKRLDTHKEQIADNTTRIAGHDVQIGRLEEWKQGYNAAAAIGKHTPEI